MRQNRRSKIVAILALCVSVVGLTLGFAAFSNTLTISSSATVSPNKSDFKISAYGRTKDAHVYNINAYTLNQIEPEPIANSTPIDAAIANISEDGLHISNMSVSFDNSDAAVGYYFAIKNEGKYDAYINLENYFFPWIRDDQPNIVCTARPGTNQKLVDQACKNISFLIAFTDSSLIEVIPESDEANYHLLPAGDYIFAEVIIQYQSAGTVLADGDFDVEIEDVTFDFSTVAPE